MKTLILAAMIFGITCCKSSRDVKNSKAQSAEKQALSTNYKVLSMEGVASLVVIPTMKFDFALNKVNGFAGCNDYGGAMSMDGNKIKFSKFMATEMYCDSMTIEREFLSKLTKIAYFKITGSQLEMYNLQDELLLVFQEDN